MTEEINNIVIIISQSFIGCNHRRQARVYLPTYVNIVRLDELKFLNWCQFISMTFTNVMVEDC